MKCQMLWYGGPSYAAPRNEDAEEFPSLRAAKAAFWLRADSDPRFPCVEDSEGHIYFGPITENGPDRVLTLGPRGGVRVIFN